MVRKSVGPTQSLNWDFVRLVQAYELRLPPAPQSNKIIKILTLFCSLNFFLIAHILRVKIGDSTDTNETIKWIYIYTYITYLTF
jgi:hypothetical protein